MSTDIPFQREIIDTYATTGYTLRLNPWVVQNICLELIANYFLANDPQKNGYTFTQKYSTDKLKSDIFLDIANHWDAKVIGQRPAIFISRDDCRTANQIMNQFIGGNPAESEKKYMDFNYLNVGIACIATNIGFTEQLADYVKHPFKYFQEVIRNDYRFSRFRLLNVSPPQKYVEATDRFIIMLTIETMYNESWIIKGDDLKLKTASRTIFDALTGSQFVNA